jgi:hypothetical protein
MPEPCPTTVAHLRQVAAGTYTTSVQVVEKKFAAVDKSASGVCPGTSALG